MTNQLSRPRRTRNAARTTAQILETAQTEFAKSGFSGARVDRIALDSGTNKALLFQRFDDKAGLYAAVLERVRQDASATRATFVARVTSTDKPRSSAQFHELVGRLVEVNIAFLVQHPEAAAILHWERASGWVAFRQAALDSIDEPGSALLALFEDAAEHGWIRSTPSPAVQLAMTFDVPHTHFASLSRNGSPVAQTAEWEFVSGFVADGLVEQGDAR
ncbi:TetR/AcrR family transcriptional regulator [Paramicrobacterium chengjingii]|uniref:TetR/AcrR family transcriptional regulator n=1 Tax=Paramicrobacterium chengjingii TaxID=2769067 RepID=UPI001424669E|nr:TetR/AcrR family transcriptional regulator [Microbacterium chengjingii]